jgi:hypothetical protein
VHVQNLHTASGRWTFCSRWHGNAIRADFRRVPLPRFIKTVTGERDSYREPRCEVETGQLLED